MAQTGYERPQPGDAAPKVSAETARQGQNVKGMIWVLIIGVALVVIAYAVMLALQTEPVTTDNRSIENVNTVAPPPASTDSGQTQETLKSPQ